MPRPAPTRNTARRPPRRGAALLLCLFIVFIISSLLLNVLDTETLQLSAARNVEDYERALYLANAGVHHALAMIEGGSTDRDTFDSNGDPVAPGTPVPDGSYQFTITDVDTDSDGDDEAFVEASGASGNVVRNLEAIIDLP